MKKLTLQRILTFQKYIFSWWKGHKRDLPWRHTHDPYKILVSEIMLQQTQVSRGFPKYYEFLTTFPTVQSLAAASPGDVLRVWKGMGYNRRAVYLQAAAKRIVNEHRSVFPRDEKQLLALPGIGPYTARAVLVFAFKKDIAMVDTNIRQIITHFFFDNVPQSEKSIQTIADQLVPKGKSWEWHQALMDYSALELRKDKGQRQKSDNKRKSLPFKETKRYFRGRIIDSLRDRPYIQNELLQTLCELYGKDISFYVLLLENLKTEGLIENKKGIWMLKE